MSHPLLAAPFETPSVEYTLLLPMLIVFGVALMGVLIEAFMPRPLRHETQLGLALVGLVAAFVAVVSLAGDNAIAAGGSIAIDGPALFLQGAILLLAIPGVLTAADRRVDVGGSFAPSGSSMPGSSQERLLVEERVTQTEIVPLLMFAIGGMLLFPASNDLLTMFVALEVLSLPLYLLCGLARRRRLISQEAAMKYFLLGAFSSAFFLYGIALVYGYAGSFELAEIDTAVSASVGSSGLLLTGMALLAVGLLFKVSAAPFHAWTPDVYQGAPTAVTGFMAACTKVAAFGALLRVFYVGLGGARWDWEPLMWIVAALTMAVGSIIAITQTDIKRMLAYSSIAHAGFLITGFVGAQQGLSVAGQEISSLQAVMFYLVAYGFTTIGAFALVTVVRDAGGETTALSRWAGLGKEAPVVAGVFALFLLALAGIPLTSGFTGKWAVFASAWSGGAWPLVVVAVLMSAVAAFFYVRVIVIMFFSEPVGDGPTVAVPSILTTVAVTVGAAMTLLLGVVPQPVFDLARHAGEFIR